MLNSETSFRKLLGSLIVAATVCWASLALADATMVYEMSDADGDNSQYTFTIVGRFVRIEGGEAEKTYWLYDSGFRKLYEIDDDKRQYKLVRLFNNPHMETAPTPDTAKSEKTSPESDSKPKLVASKEKKNVAGVRCRVIMETVNDEIMARHCMAGTGPLGMTKREVYTLSRLLTAPGQLQFGWLGTATSDEHFATVQSQARDGQQGLELKSISHDTVPDERVQIPKTYRNLDAPVPTKEVPPQEPGDTSKSS